MARRYLLAAILQFSAGGLAPVGSAVANWYGHTGYAASCPLDSNITDDKDISFFYIDDDDPLNQATNAANWTRNNLLDPDPSLTTNKDASQYPSTDVVVISKGYDSWCESSLGIQWVSDADFVNGTTVGKTYGLENCQTLHTSDPNARCESANSRISLIYLNHHSSSDDHYLTCHEIGHGIGLAHRNISGCMQVGDSSSPAYTQHDVDHFAADWSTQPRSGV